MTEKYFLLGFNVDDGFYSVKIEMYQFEESILSFPIQFLPYEEQKILWN